MPKLLISDYPSLVTMPGVDAMPDAEYLILLYNESSLLNISLLYNLSVTEDGVSESDIKLGEDLKILMKIVPFLVPVLFSFIIILGFIGNLLVVFVVLLNKNMRNTTNLLILNLAVSVMQIRNKTYRFWVLTENETSLTSNLLSNSRCQLKLC